MSRKTSDVFRAGDITVDGTLNSNESQLIFRARQKPYNPYSGQYYSLSAAQIDDPTIRINQYAANGTFENFGYLYDTQFNPIPPGTRISVAGGVGDPTQEPNPCIIYSYDNIHWDTWSNPTNLFAGGGCTALAYNDFIFAAGGLGVNNLLYSANGSTWIASSSGTSLCAGGCNNIATNGGFWIAGTSGAHRLIFSFDGINWYASSNSIGGADYYLSTSCNAAAWSGSLWLAGGSGINNIIHSTDGTFWQGSNNSNTIFVQCNAIAWNGTFWLAGGIPATLGGPTLIKSFDGDTWTPVPVTAYPSIVTSLSISCNAIAWSGAQWVIGGEDASGNVMAYSYDGSSWFPGTNSIFISCKAVSWNGNSWAAAGLGTNSLVTSFDGADWTPNAEGNRLLIEGGAVAVNKILPNASTVQQITVTATSSALTLIGASGETVIAFSKDGITWTPSTSASKVFTGAACLALSWNGSGWVTGLANVTIDFPYTMGNSSDGIVWGANASGTSLLNISCNSIANNGAYWIAGGAGDTTRLIYAIDGNGYTWADITQSHAIFDASGSNNGAQGFCNTVGWNGLLWVAGSNCKNNRLAYSYDISNNWTASATGNAIFTSSCNSVAWNGLLWVAVGSANNNNSSVAAYSYDGITWTDISDTDVKGARRWAAVACNESVWIMGGRQTSGDCILFSYDGIHWSLALGTGAFFQNGCTGVTWNGVVWVATGSGSNSAIYSYNGATWTNSYNGDGIFPTDAQTVAANRPQATTGATRPTPTLYANDIPSVGAVTYTPKDARLNSLYPSNTLFLDDIRRNVGINIVPTTHLNVGGSTITPVLDISSGGTGTGIYVESGNGTEPSLSLVNLAVGARVARIEMVNRANSAGWSIDDSNADHLQLTSWKNNQAFTVMDITPGNSSSGGKVDINGIDPLDPNGAALYIDGRNNDNDLAISVKGNVNVNGNNSRGAAFYVNGTSNTSNLAAFVEGNINVNGIDLSGAALYVNGSANTGKRAVTVEGNVNMNGIDPSGAALYVNGSTNPGTLALNVVGVTTLQVTRATDVYLNKINPNAANVQIGSDTVNLTVQTSDSAAARLIGAPALRLYKSGNGNYVEFNGTQLIPSPTNTLDLGTISNFWNNLYVNKINQNTTSLQIGSDTVNLTVQTSDATAAQLIGAPALRLYKSGNGNYVEFNGTQLIPSPTNTLDLGTISNFWNNLYVNKINQNTTSLQIGSDTVNLTVQTSDASATRLIGAPALRLYTSGLPNYVEFNGTQLVPSLTNTLDLGTSSIRWNNLYSTNVNTTSAHAPGYRLYLGTFSNRTAVILEDNGTTTSLLPGLGANVVDIGSSSYPFRNLYTSNINPFIDTANQYVLIDSSIGGTSYFTLPGGFTWSLNMIIVGSGGSGCHWLNYVPPSINGNGAGGSGGYLQVTKSNVPGGTQITCVIGAAQAGNNTPVPTPVDGVVSEASGIAGQSSSVSFVDGGIGRSWIAGGGAQVNIRVTYSTFFGGWFLPTSTSGVGGTNTLPGGSYTTIANLNGNEGVNVVPPLSTNGSGGGASVYSPYGTGGNGGYTDPNGGNSASGYVKITATPTDNISYANSFAGKTRIDTLYVKQIVYI